MHSSKRNFLILSPPSRICIVGSKKITVQIISYAKKSRYNLILLQLVSIFFPSSIKYWYLWWRSQSTNGLNVVGLNRVNVFRVAQNEYHRLYFSYGIYPDIFGPFLCDFSYIYPKIEVMYASLFQCVYSN